MSDFLLEHPVMTLERKVLLPAGTVVTEQVLAEVAALGKLENRDQFDLMEHATVRVDLEKFLQTTPYQEIFAEYALVEEVLQVNAKVRLPVAILQSLDYFRRHDFHTYRHILMVFTLTSLLGKHMAIEGYSQDDEALAGPTHDIGKICIPLEILKKTSPLTPQERAYLNFHPLAGYVLMTYYLQDHRHPAALVARDHHERRDGSGYPRKARNVRPLVEMVAACDIYDALISPRPYRPLSYDNRTALEELTAMAEHGQVSWDAVSALVALNRGQLSRIDQVEVSLDKRGAPPIGNCYGILATEPDETPLPSTGIARSTFSH